jgi:dihydroorotate dehydrogenase (NAD+) catalytic subunit
MGGIETGAHAREFLAAGARAVAVGTASFRDPLAAVRVVRELESGAAEPAAGTSAASDGALAPSTST